MAALPLANLSSSISYLKRRPLALSEQRLAANRRNAARSTGPRTSAGKARVARNAIKHGFFADVAQWTQRQRQEFGAIFDGLREEFRPQTAHEEIHIATIADCYIRMAAMLRYESVAALNKHRREDRALNERIAAAEPSEAAQLRKYREELRNAGLWRPTIPGPRDAKAIIRYEGRLHRAIRCATAELKHLRKGKRQKQTHFDEQSRGIFQIADRVFKRSARTQPHRIANGTSRASAPATNIEDVAKTNPLNSVIPGNRHQRRRAKALARRGKGN